MASLPPLLIDLPRNPLVAVGIPVGLGIGESAALKDRGIARSFVRGGTDMLINRRSRHGVADSQWHLRTQQSLVQESEQAEI